MLLAHEKLCSKKVYIFHSQCLLVSATEVLTWLNIYFLFKTKGEIKKNQKLGKIFHSLKTAREARQRSEGSL